MIIEVCVDTLEQAIDAQKKGADRLELCSHLEFDGLSPDVQLIEKVVQYVSIPIKIMVRPRAGDFIYNDTELAMMMQYCLECASFPIDGFVVGMLTSDKQIDLPGLNQLLLTVNDHPFTFHKAIDLIEDPIREIRRCDHLKNLTHILTSGRKDNAFKGIPMIHKMVSMLEPRYKIIAAGKITPMNLDEIRKATNATEFHGRNIL